jgi:hypothetical protein
MFSLKNVKGNASVSDSFGVFVLPVLIKNPGMYSSFNEIILTCRQKVVAETSTSSLEEDIEMLSFDSRTESSSLPSSQVI